VPSLLADRWAGPQPGHDAVAAVVATWCEG